MSLFKAKSCHFSKSRHFLKSFPSNYDADLAAFFLAYFEPPPKISNLDRSILLKLSI